MINAEEQQEMRKKFNPDNSLLRNHQLRMLDILTALDELCNKHNIKYWLSSGTLLGAVRHSGFIPWDDDVDIEMLRKDYKKLERAIKEYGLKDYILQTNKTDHNYLAPYAKLRDLKSSIKENCSNDEYYKYNGVYIDVFIMDPSSSYYINKICDVLQHKLLYRMNSSIKRKFLRKIYFSAVCFLLENVLFALLRFINRLFTKDQLRHTLGSGFLGPRYKSEIFPLQTLPFEGKEFKVPNNYDSYLKRIYGNYMSLPKTEEMKTHTTSVILNKK